MTAFIRRFTQNPGLDVISEIEGVVLIDNTPPGQVGGTGSRPLVLVGEFENGPFNTPTEIFGANDQFAQFGEFGFVYAGQPAQNPCARSRKPDSVVNAQYWNGNGYVWLSAARFTRIFLCRVDTSVGSVSFTREASLIGANSADWNLEPGQVLVLDIGAGNVTATFDAAVATKLSADGTYATTFTGGESITYKIDGVTYTTYFLAADQSHVQVVARLNATVGFTAFATSTLKTSITGRKRGTGGSVQIVSVSSGLVTTATGFSAGSAQAGTGDADDIDHVTDAEVNAVLATDAPGAFFDRDPSGNARIVNTTTPGTGTIQVDSTTTATAFGFPTETTADAAVGIDSFIPAGTRVRTGGGLEFVTMRDVVISAANAGPYSVKVRHGLDDGTGGLAAVAAVSVLADALTAGAFQVTNPLPITAALSEAALDAAYSTALDATVDINKDVQQANIVACARRSNAVRNLTKTNAINASANGCRGRVAVVSPPLGITSRAVARGSSAPGVGATRSDRCWYGFPGVRQFIPRIAAVGIAGGAGFTADGVIDVASDKVIASLSSCLPPEENIGQETDLLSWVLGVEAGNADVQSLGIDDYKAFKRAGIMAPNVNGVVTVQSAVTSVDPTALPGRVNANRRAFSDYLLDSLGEYARPWSKLLATQRRRGQLVGQFDAFVQGLVAQERAEKGLVDGKSANTPDILARGIFWVKVKVRMVSTMLDIVIDGEIGENVKFTDQ